MSDTPVNATREKEHREKEHSLESISAVKEILLRNHRVFARESPFLDALLVFAGLFSAILAAFLIEVRKGLQEDLLDQILQELRKSDDPFKVTPVSVWVNGLWFASLSLSLAGALFVILAKAMGRRVVDKEEIQLLFSAITNGPRLGSDAPDSRTRTTGLNRYSTVEDGEESTPLDDILQRCTRAQKSFKKKFEFLMIASTISIYTSLILFYPGLVVLIYTNQKGIGTSVAVIASGMGFFTFACILHDIWSASQVDVPVFE